MSNRQPFQQRVADEKSELDDRLKKLKLFQVTEVFDGLPDAEKARLRCQQLVMQCYSELLYDRINAFE